MKLRYYVPPLSSRSFYLMLQKIKLNETFPFYFKAYDALDFLKSLIFWQLYCDKLNMLSAIYFVVSYVYISEYCSKAMVNKRQVITKRTSKFTLIRIHIRKLSKSTLSILKCKCICWFCEVFQNVTYNPNIISKKHSTFLDRCMK